MCFLFIMYSNTWYQIYIILKPLRSRKKRFLIKYKTICPPSLPSLSLYMYWLKNYTIYWKMVKKGRVFSSHILELMKDVTAKNQHDVAAPKTSYLLKCVYFVEVGRIVFICFSITVATFHRTCDQNWTGFPTTLSTATWDHEPVKQLSSTLPLLQKLKDSEVLNGKKV